MFGGGVQNLELSNVERPIFRNLKITNIKIAKDELFDYFIYELIFYYYFLNYLNTQRIWQFFYIMKFSKLLYFENFIIFQIRK